jgi:hypothetical protein
MCWPSPAVPETVGTGRDRRTIFLRAADPNAGLADLGGVPLTMTAAEFGKLVADETEKWGKVDPGSQYQSGLRQQPARGSTNRMSRSG